MRHPGYADEDKPHEECGVVGVWAPGADVARLTLYALYALQHRGQESTGIAVIDGATVQLHKGMGLVSVVFGEEDVVGLKGNLAIGHTRYSTTGASLLRNAQPFVLETLRGPLGVAHNGNLTNAQSLRRELLERGVGLTSSSDTEVIAQMLGTPSPNRSRSASWEDQIAAFMEQAVGAYSLAVLTRDAVFAVRDPWGFRPLCVGRLELGGGKTGWVTASESCALTTIGAELVREVAPGEIVRLDQNGLTSTRGREPSQRSFCVFEFVYFGRSDSQFDDMTVHLVRQELGRQLAREAPVPAGADVVVSVPSSSRPAAIGYSLESELPFNEGFAKNNYIGRTFIQPDERLRKTRVVLKYNPIAANVRGKRIVMVDDSIVRGNTVGPLVKMLRSVGALEVHVRVSSPPIQFPCFMGTDIASRTELIGASKSPEDIRRETGADSLAYLSYEGMIQAVKAGLSRTLGGYCGACFTGDYPVPVDECVSLMGDRKLSFEARR